MFTLDGSVAFARLNPLLSDFLVNDFLYIQRMNFAFVI